MLGIFLFLTMLLVPISWVASRYPKAHFRVKSITFGSESKITNKYEGLLFVTKKGSNYVFVDYPSETSSTIFIINESDVKEIVFVHE